MTNNKTSLNDIVKEVSQTKVKNINNPDISDWNPAFSGDMDMRIAVDGRWYHEGSTINREALVRTFASILRLEDDECYYLVTPVEKFRIQVDDAPFVVVDMIAEGVGENRQLIFITNVGDRVLVGSKHPITVIIDAKGHPRPYVIVRHNLKALISRNIFYQMVDLGEAITKDNITKFGIWCAGEFFELGELHD